MKFVDPVEPGYYTIHPGNLNLQECRRFRLGGIPPILFYAIRSFISVPLAGVWLPQYVEDARCDSADLSGRCIDALLPEISKLERLGFNLLSYANNSRHLWPHMLDNGSCYFLHPGELCSATVEWGWQNLSPGKSRAEPYLIVSFSVFYESGLNFLVTNCPKYFDPYPGQMIYSDPESDVNQLWLRVQRERELRSRVGEVMCNLTSVSDWEKVENNRLKRTWHEWVHVRKLMVRMTEEQVEAARRRMPPPIE